MVCFIFLVKKKLPIWKKQKQNRRTKVPQNIFPNRPCDFVLLKLAIFRTFATQIFESMPHPFRTFFALAVCLVFSQNTFSQTQKLTPELLWQIGRVGLECVSPDGKTAVYGVQRFDIHANNSTRVLYAVEISSGKTIALTPAEKSASDAEFFPDGSKIAFLMDGKLQQVQPDGSRLSKVSDFEMNGFHFSPDGKKLLFVQDVKYDATSAERQPDLPKNSAKIFDGLFYRHWKSWADQSYSNIFILEIENGRFGTAPKNIMNEPFDSPTPPDGGMEKITWSPDGRFIAYTSRKLSGTAEAQSTNTDIYMYELASGRTTNISEGRGGYDFDPVFSPDGKYFAYTSQATPGYEADRTRLMLVDLQTSQTTELTENWDFEANQPQFSADSKSIYFLSSKNFTYQIFKANLAPTSRTEKQFEQITDGQWDFNNFKVVGNQLIASRTAMDAPAEIFTVNLTDRKINKLTSVTDDPWSNISKGKIERRSVKTTDGKDMNVWVIYPPDFDKNKKYPALLVCQGGPQSAMSQGFSFRWNYQLMAANGYIVIAPCRRGMPGSGTAWNDAIAGDYGGQPMRDLLSATDALANEPFVDKNRLGAVGASFGGYSVYWLAGHHEKRFKTFISHCGMFNLETFYGTTEEVWFPNHDFEGAFWQKPTPKMYTDGSNPIRSVDKWDTPIFVIHNELDFRVPFSEGMQAFQAAQLRGIKSRFLSFPDEGHWMSKAQNSIFWQREFFQWLKETL